jgi:DNA-binding FadR family transcriptional regulator
MSVEALNAFISERGLRDGDALPPERQLAELLGVSRRELRAALSMLEASGRVWRGVGRGTYLGSRPIRFAPTVAGLGARTSPADVAEMRLAIEPAFAALAAIKASPEDLAELENCARKNATARDDDEWQKWDHRFHLLIAQATRNPAIIALMEAINGVRARPTLREKTVDDRVRQRFAAEHKVIVDCMMERDADAAYARMRDHLANVAARLHVRETRHSGT